MPRIKEPAGPRVPPPVEEALPKAHRVSLEAPELPRARKDPTPEDGPGETRQSAIGFLARLFQRHERAVSAVLIGATAVPALLGNVAHAAEPAPGEVKDDAAPTDTAKEILFGEAKSERWRPVPKRADEGTLHVAGMYDALSRWIVDRQLAVPPPTTAPAATQEIIRADRAVTEKFARGVHEVLSDGTKVPIDLARDLIHVEQKLRDAKPGTLDRALLEAIETAPSFNGPNTNLTGPEAPEVRKNALKKLFDATQTAGVRRAANAIERYSTTVGPGPSLPTALPNFTYVTPGPLRYRDAGGNVFNFPTGTVINKAGPAYTVLAPNATLATNGLNLNLGTTVMRTTNGIDSLDTDALTFSEPGASGTLTNVGVAVDRTRSTGFIRADKADVNLDDGTVHLENARVRVSKVGDTALLTGSGTAVNTQVGGTSFTADTIDLSLVDGPAGSAGRMQATNVAFSNADLAMSATNADLRVISNADGSGAIRLLGTDVSATIGQTAISTVGKSAVSIDQRADGTLSGASVSAAQVELTDPRGTLSATGGELDLSFGANGKLESATGRATTLAFANDTDAFSANGGAIDVKWREDGTMSGLTAKAQDASYLGSKGSLAATNGAIDAQFGADGALSKLAGKADAVSFTAKGGEVVNATKTRLELDFHEDGALSRAATKLGTMHATLKDGSTLEVKDGAGLAVFDDAGRLVSAEASAGKLRYTFPGGEVLTAGKAKVETTHHAGGALATVAASAKTVDYSAEGRALSIDRGKLSLSYGEDGALEGLSGAARHVTYSTGEGALTVTGAKITGTTTGGKLDAIDFTGKKIVYDGAAEHGHDVDVLVHDVSAKVKLGADGSQSIDFSTGSGELSFDGKKVAVEHIEKLSIRTNAEGAVTDLELRVPGQTTITDQGGDLSVAIRDAQGAMHEEGGVITARFGEIDVALASKKLNAEIRGVTGTMTEREVRIHIDQGKLVRDLEKQLKVKVENVDILIEKDADGKVGAIDIQLEKLKARVKDMNIRVRTENGERVRLHMTTGADGTLIREAFLQVPSGGEIRLKKDDLKLVIGESRFTFEQDGTGWYRLGATDFNVSAELKKTQVKVQGGEAAISLNADGRLVIEKIHGTKIDVDHKGQHIDIDIEKLDGFIFKMTGVSGGAQGAQIHLIPTSESSVIKAEIRTTVGGIPVSLELDDVHELKGIAEIKTDEVYVYLGDPSGRGRVSLGAGPLKLKGSAIEVFANYNRYDTERMFQSVSSFMSKEGLELVKGVKLEPDGVLRLSTPWNGPMAELSLLLPRSQGALPAYMLNVGGSGPATGGAILTLGGRGQTGGGTEVAGGVFVGAVPGSYMDVNISKGELSFGGIPLPDRFKLPTTAVGGLTLDLNKGPSRFSATAGAFVNPADFAPDSVFSETVRYGGFGGVRYENAGRVSLGADALVNVNKDGQPQLGGVRFNLGVRF